ncbi:glycoside hydrolase family 95 protein [Altererythrobacter sp.]|uniref:glycoside hydrolase family 95 protein n=1 Tax=Altererythrobacter sp. TaxID=1872480 RepID=UPI003D11A5B4
MAVCGLAALPFKLGATTRPGALDLIYGKPAGEWVEALPVGNGRIGGMVFGGVLQERIQLNEDTLWAGSPYDPNNPDAAENLARVRELIDRGEFKQAADLTAAALMAKPLRQMPYGTAGDILIDLPGTEAPRTYERGLDLHEAIQRTSYRNGQGAFLRETFVSPVDQVLVLRLTATDGGKLDLNVRYRHPGPAQYGLVRYDGSSGELRAAGASWDHREPLRSAERPADIAIQPDGASALLITGKNVSAEGIPAGLSYAVNLRAVADGRVATDGETLQVRGAETVTLYVSVATSHVTFKDVSGDPVSRVRRDTIAAAQRPYAELKAEHVRSHRERFDRFHIELGGDASPAGPTDRRIIHAAHRDDPALAALYVQYARYLLLSSSREGSQPANLQGIWNEGNFPPWGSKYTININTEMNYWPAAPANLTECFEPLLRMVEDLTVTGAVTAREMYGARGWMAHHNTDLWRATAPIDGPMWGMWPAGGAWLCTTLWDWYDYTRDPQVLKRLYPVIRDAALFFVDALVEDPQGRGLVTSPSISPENPHPFGEAICSGPACDRQILRDLFDRARMAHDAVGQPKKDRKIIAEIAAARSRLAPDRIGAQGQLQEWLEDWDAQAPDQQHRHVSHLYAVYPSMQMNLRDTPDFIEAAKVTLNTRGDLATGWGTAWRLCLWARMGEAERAYSILKGLLGFERTYPNMFDAHPPFQIDGNFGGAAGILEMILQSWGGEIHLLPALPSAWNRGRVRGIRARGGVVANLAWDQGRLVSASFSGPKGSELKLRYDGAVHRLKLAEDGTGQFLLP